LEGVEVSTYDHSSFPGKPVQQGDARQEALKLGLERLATVYGVEWRPRLFINSLGEIDLFLIPGQKYGEQLAALISKHNPRCGIRPGAYMDPSNSWCMMNHFDVQRMLEEWGG
jgi:hypothetical protein